MILHHLGDKAQVIEFEFFEPVEPALIASILANNGFSIRDWAVVERIE
jgi:hypothetical protein